MTLNWHLLLAHTRRCDHSENGSSAPISVVAFGTACFSVLISQSGWKVCHHCVCVTMNDVDLAGQRMCVAKLNTA